MGKGLGKRLTKSLICMPINITNGHKNRGLCWEAEASWERTMGIKGDIWNTLNNKYFFEKGRTGWKPLDLRNGNRVISLGFLLISHVNPKLGAGSL